MKALEASNDKRFLELQGSIDKVITAIKDQAWRKAPLPPVTS